MHMRGAFVKTQQKISGLGLEFQSIRHSLRYCNLVRNIKVRTERKNSQPALVVRLQGPWE